MTKRILFGIVYLVISSLLIGCTESDNAKTTASAQSRATVQGTSVSTEATATTKVTASTEITDTPDDEPQVASPTQATSTEIPIKIESRPEAAIACQEEPAVEEAGDMLDEALESDDDEKKAEAFLRRGQEYMQQGEFDKAITDFTEALHYNENLTGALVMRGTCYIFLGDIDRSMEDFNVAVSQFTQRIEVEPTAENYMDRGTAYYFLREFDKAIADFDQAIVIDPNNTRAYTVRGNVYDDSGYFDKALESYGLALEVASLEERSLTLADKGKAYALHGDAALAAADLEEALSICEGLGPAVIQELKAILAEIYFHLGQESISSEDTDQAKDYYTWSIELFPHIAGVFLERGRINVYLGDYELAILYLKDALVVDSDYHETYYLMGLALIFLERYDEALAEMEAFIDRVPDNGYGFYLRGICYMNLGMEDSAIDDFEKALELGLDDERAADVQAKLNALKE